MKEKITLADLRKWGACDVGMAWFDGRFPCGAALDELEAALRANSDDGEEWLVWLARKLAIGRTGDSIERRLSWCGNEFDRAWLACRMPVGLPGDSLERRLEWCYSTADRAYVIEHYDGKIPER
jgi:hypothetical protein